MHDHRIPVAGKGPILAGVCRLRADFVTIGAIRAVAVFGGA
jgi:hypothetical protein